jgi:hypothetical protein
MLLHTLLEPAATWRNPLSHTHATASKQSQLISELKTAVSSLLCSDKYALWRRLEIQIKVYLRSRNWMARRDALTFRQQSFSFENAEGVFTFYVNTNEK